MWFRLARRLSPALPAIALLTLGGCGKGDNEPGPGGVTVGEARALDEAAEMLEDRRLPAAAQPTPEAQPTPPEGASAQGPARPAVQASAKPGA